MIKMTILALNHPTVESDGWVTLEQAMANYEDVIDTCGISPADVISVNFVKYGKDISHD